MIKMRFCRFLLVGITLSILLVSLAGCSHAIRQSTALSEAGANYADAVHVLLEVTSDTVIEDDSNSLLYQQKLTQYEDKKIEKKELKEYLNKHNKEVKTILITIGQFQRHTRILKNYFINLRLLASTDAPQRAAKAVEELSTNINVANSVINKADGSLISDEERDAFGKLAGLVAKGVQAKMLRKALKRDAPIIAEQLLLHEKLLAKLSGMLKHRYAKKLVVLDKEVRKPYVAKAISNNEQWKISRKKVLKSTFFEQNLDKAVTAARQMRLIWESILEGKEDLGSMQLLLDDINEFMAIVHQLEKTE